MELHRWTIGLGIGLLAGILGAPVQADGPAGTAVAREVGRTGPAVRAGELALPEVLDPIGPVVDDGVGAPADFTVGGYTDRQVGMRWWNRGAPLTRVFRSVTGGPWTEVQRFTQLPANAYVDFLDQAATANTEHCYRITASDGASNATAKTTPARCVITRDGRDIPVNRIQLRLRVATAAGADLDAPLEVRLQSPSWLVPTVTNWRPAGNSTWVDSTADDFERGSSRTYDLLLTNIDEVSDITQVTFAAPGDDTLCIAGFDLLLDGQPAFTRDYGNDAASCAKVGGSQLAGADYQALRASASWMALQPVYFIGYDGPGLRSVIESQFGHAMKGKGELRSGRVTSTQVDRDRARFSVPLRVYDVPLLGDVDSTVQFDMVFTRTNSGWSLGTENVDADSDDLLGYFMPILGWKILYEASQQIESRVGAIRPTTVGAPAEGLRPCFGPDAGLTACFDN